MRTFLVRVFLVVVFFIGLGGVAERVSMFLRPETKALNKFEDFQAPNLKVVKFESPRKIVIRRVQIENSDDCRLQIGPILPNQFQSNSEFGWNQKADQ